MKRLWFLGVILLFQETLALALTVTDVKVSVTANSAAAARDQALTKAHTLAFQKLLKEYFPESSSLSPPEDTLVDMVTNFSIDREKTTPQSYAASLTFHFDESHVREWIQQDLASSPSSAIPLKTEEAIIKATADYATFADWQHIKKTLEYSSGVEKVKTVSLSPQSADIEIAYRGDIPALQRNLGEEGLILTSQGQDWKISSTPPISRPQVIY